MSVVLPLIGILYGLVGLSSLVLFVIYSAFGPSIRTLSGRDVLFHLMFLIVPLLNGLVGLALLYASLAHRAWGRWLAIAFNGVFLATIAYEIFSTQFDSPRWVPFPPEEQHERQQEHAQEDLGGAGDANRVTPA
jgi:hypothetical protein